MSRYLTLEHVKAFHQTLITRFGGAFGIRDQGLLEAALARPKAGYYADVIEEAAALWESLSQNHPFFDGNKRTAVAATAVFLRINGYGYQRRIQSAEVYYWIATRYETGTMNKAKIEQWLREHAYKL